MSVISTQTVAITKSRLTKGFNGDNLNLNKRTISAEDADKGFKAAGSLKPPYFSLIASGNQKGFAAGAAAAFNDYIKDVNESKYSAKKVFERYFNDMNSVIEQCAIENSTLSLGIICVYNDCVVAAKTGSCHLMRYSEGELFEIALPESGSNFGFQFIDGISKDEMYALIGEDCSADLDYDKIVDSFESGADLKIMIRDFFNSIISRAKDKDCSLILMRLGCDCEKTYAEIPPDAEQPVDLGISDEFDAIYDTEPENFSAQPPIEQDELWDEEERISDNESPKTGKSPTLKKRIKRFIPIALLVIILAVTAALYLATMKPADPFTEPKSDAFSEPETISDIIPEEESSEDLNGSNGMELVNDDENGGDPMNTHTTSAPRTTSAQAATNAPVQNNTPEDTPEEPEPPLDTPEEQPEDAPVQNDEPAVEE